MLNPYQPTDPASLPTPVRRKPHPYTFAGLWLAGAGLFHFLALNVLSGTRSFETMDLSPLLLIAVGWGVLYRLRIAVVATRLFGSLMLIFTMFVVVLLLCGVSGEFEISYGGITIKEPELWHYAIAIATVVATILPAWWSLQRATDLHDTRRSTSQRASE